MTGIQPRSFDDYTRWFALAQLHGHSLLFEDAANGSDHRRSPSDRVARRSARRSLVSRVAGTRLGRRRALATCEPGIGG